jgi:hypothetical protein
MASTFKSNDTAIADILKDIANGANQLPDFQAVGFGTMIESAP